MPEDVEVVLVEKLTWEKSLSLPGEEEEERPNWAYKQFGEQTNQRAWGREGEWERVQRARES